ncbi:hypothetical protein EV697_102345 [Bisgaardia hudsonensis]|uniref:Lipoprotein n=1 Tax=Bisgaardia hudsonensis TaxID=109472 RepID=A0A4R2N1M8_9PAST|nr:hypothetical protein [Bisgaardia hudsonensis]TCP13459.1 hypothetical protein EV697_102345 [Bisgaardia hudsonensis]
MKKLMLILCIITLSGCAVGGGINASGGTSGIGLGIGLGTGMRF